MSLDVKCLTQISHTQLQVSVTFAASTSVYEVFVGPGSVYMLYLYFYLAFLKHKLFFIAIFYDWIKLEVIYILLKQQMV